MQKRKKRELEMFAFCVITFEPIKIQTCSTPQNDRLNLSFVNDNHVFGKKKARNGRKRLLGQAGGGVYHRR